MVFPSRTERTSFLRATRRRPDIPESPTASIPRCCSFSTYRKFSTPSAAIAKISSVRRSVRRLECPDGEVICSCGWPSAAASRSVSAEAPCTSTISSDRATSATRSAAASRLTPALPPALITARSVTAGGLGPGASRVQSDEAEPGVLGEPERHVHRLHPVARGALHQVVNRAEGDDALAARVEGESHVAEVRAREELRLRIAVDTGAVLHDPHERLGGVGLPIDTPD